MNCKYCGASLPTKGGVCPQCGRVIPVSQMTQMKNELDPRWNQYRNKDTALFKSKEAYDEKTGKIVVIIIGILIILLVIAFIKGIG